MPKRVFPKAYQTLIDSILYTRRRLAKPRQTRKHFKMSRTRPTQKRCTRRK